MRGRSVSAGKVDQNAYASPGLEEIAEWRLHRDYSLKIWAQSMNTPQGIMWEDMEIRLA
ncbi:MAG: hypothetical protein V1875_01500 [Candidatus Altiarchaeota archaeon]